MPSDEVQFKVRIDPDLKRLVDADSRTNKELAAAALWREFGGEREKALDIQIEHKDKQIKNLTSEIEKLEEERQAAIREKAALERKKQEMVSAEEKYEQELARLLTRLEEGEVPRLTPASKSVRDLADGRDKTPEEVHNDLKEKAARDDRRIYNTQFMAPPEADALPIAEKELMADVYRGGSA